ncbi:MAG: hypothetical protein WBR26_04960 [Candidatus Acidiferrum sp.]
MNAIGERDNASLDGKTKTMAVTIEWASGWQQDIAQVVKPLPPWCSQSIGASGELAC